MYSRIHNEYFDWLFNMVSHEAHSKQFSYKNLLVRLHDTEFIYLIPNDQNRAEDGIDLRYKFAMTNGYLSNYRTVLDILEGPCSVLEMMIALAIRCEETLMDDPSYGDRTSQWFWEMVISLGLGQMVDSNFDRDYVDQCLEAFLYRDYAPNGKGGLFTIRDSKRDLRSAEIWSQLNWYLNSIM